LHAELFCEPNPIPAKWALYAMEKVERGIRLPMTWLTPINEPKVRAALAHAGITIHI